MLVPWPWVIETVTVVVATKFIKAFYVEIEAIWVIEIYR